jgi:hypothetical protein
MDDVIDLLQLHKEHVAHVVEELCEVKILDHPATRQYVLQQLGVMQQSLAVIIDAVPLEA